MSEDQKPPSAFAVWAKAHPIRAMVVLPAFIIFVGAVGYFAFVDMIAKGKWVMPIVAGVLALRSAVTAYKKQKNAQSASEISKRFL